jgi:ComF family protein
MNKISKAESGQSGFGFSLYHFIWQTADWLYPPVCAGCGKPDSRFCRDCFSQVITIAKPICEICGAPIQPNEKCPECEDHPPRFDRLRSWSVFSGPLREALHSLKYKSNLGIAEILAQPLISILNEEKWDFDVVIPIPLGKSHLRQRGYNQAQAIARPISLAMNRVLLSNAVTRVKETSSQINLTPVQRYANLQDAFLANPAKLNGRKVLLVDDVATTGATLNSCAEALRAVGVSKVYCITVAKALRKDHRIS